MSRSPRPDELLAPYVPRLLVSWLRETPEATFREIEGTLAFVDISGFTKLTERLARKGKVGAEEVNDALDAVFGRLLSVAYDYGAGVVKWGGDAVLLLFDGPDHAPRACRAAAEMQRALRSVGRISTSSGQVTLRMSVGIHSGCFHFFLVGDLHRELLLTGPGASRTVEMETIAEAGEIAVSPQTAALLAPADVGRGKDDALLLRRAPRVQPERAAAVGETADLDLAHCLCGPIRELLLGGVVQPEHRSVTAAFVEFRDVDAALASRGPFAVATDLDALIRATQHAADRFDVTFFETDIARDGGKIMLIGGAPRTTGHDEEAMLHVAREILRAGSSFPLRIGVNTGRVFAGNFGPAYRRTYSVKGDAINTAARVMGKARLGEALATEATLGRSRATFATEPRGPFQLKGKAKPLNAFAVGARQVERRERERPSSLVGRDAELAALLELVGSARGGSGAIVELAGEPGVGKSRLVDELLDRADGFRALEVACSEYESSTPYRAAGRILRRALWLADDEDPATVAAGLRSEVEERTPDLVPWLPLLALLLDVEVEPTPEVEQLEERFRRERLATALGGVLAELIPSPTIIVLDDVHWMDEASAEALSGIGSVLAARPWLLITTRSGADDGLMRPAHAPGASIHLETLSRESATALVDAVTDDLPLPRHQVEALVAQADGNPLFLRELVSAVRAGADELPHSVEALLAAQIDRLPPAARSALRVASVIGMVVPRAMLDELLDETGLAPSDSVERALDTFLEPDGAESLRFRHALVRDAAYEGLPFRQRRELHARLGEAILARAGSEPELEAELLSRHFFHAQRFDEAWRYSRIAAERAARKYANAEAAEFYRRALQASRRASGIPATEIAQAWESLGDIADRIGAYREASEAYRAARRSLPGEPISEARLLMREAWILEQSGRRVQALRTLGRGLTALRDVKGPEATTQRAQLAVWYAWSRYHQGRHRDAIRWCERAADEAEAAGSRETMAWAYMILDIVGAEIGVPETIPYGRLALSIYEELGDLPKQASVLNNLGGRAFYEGRWDDARELADRARALYLQTGDTAALADCTFNIAELLTIQGRFAEAEQCVLEAQLIWKAAGSAYVSVAASELGRIAYLSGRPEDGLELLEEARATFEAAGAETEVRETDVRIAECLLALADPHRALELLERIGEAITSHGEVASVRIPRLERIRGYTLLQLDETVGARTAFERAVRVGGEQGADYEVALALTGLARIAGLDGPGDAADLEAQSAEMLERLGVVALPALAVPIPA